MKDDITPEKVEAYSNAAIEGAADERERRTLLALKQHTWDLAICVQQLKEALDGREASDRRAG